MIAITSINGGASLHPGDALTIIGTDFGVEGGTLFLRFTVGGPDPQVAQVSLASTLQVSGGPVWTDTQITWTLDDVREYLGVYTGGINSPFTSLQLRVTRLESGSDGESADANIVMLPPAGYAVADVLDTWTHGNDVVLSHISSGFEFINGLPVQVIHEAVTDEGSAVSINSAGVITIATPTNTEEFEFAVQSPALNLSPDWYSATQGPRAIPLRSIHALTPNPLNRYTGQNSALRGIIRGQIVNRVRAERVT